MFPSKLYLKLMPSVPFLSTLKFDVVAFGPVVKPSLIHFNLVASTQWQNFGKRMILSVFFASSMELSWQHISPIPNSIWAADILAAATRRRCEEDPVMPTCLKSVYDIKTRCSAWGQCQQLGFLVGSKPHQIKQQKHEGTTVSFYGFLMGAWEKTKHHAIWMHGTIFP